MELRLLNWIDTIIWIKKLSHVNDSKIRNLVKSNYCQVLRPWHQLLYYGSQNREVQRIPANVLDTICKIKWEKEKEKKEDQTTLYLLGTFTLKDICVAVFSFPTFSMAYKKKLDDKQYFFYFYVQSVVFDPSKKGIKKNFWLLVKKNC